MKVTSIEAGVPGPGERDHRAVPSALADSLQRPMEERLALAVSWNRAASELRVGLSRIERRTADR